MAAAGLLRLRRRAGAAGVGLGSKLITKEVLQQKQFETITTNPYSHRRIIKYILNVQFEIME